MLILLLVTGKNIYLSYNQLLMKRISFILFFIVSFLYCNAQNRFLAIDIYKSKGVKRVRLYEKDKVIIKLKNGQKCGGAITVILDTSIVIAEKNVIPINNIHTIIIDNSHSIPKTFSTFFVEAGVGLFAISAVNNIITDDPPIIRHPIVVA